MDKENQNKLDTETYQKYVEEFIQAYNQWEQPDTSEVAYLDTQEGVDMVLNQLQDIDQPLNSQLSSLLQLVCLMSGDIDLVQYLLQKGANPNYLDYRGWTARDYACFNPNPYAPILICSLLKPYESKFPKEDANTRRWEILTWALKMDGN